MAPCFTHQDRIDYDVIAKKQLIVAPHNKASFLAPDKPTACLGGFIGQLCCTHFRDPDCFGLGAPSLQQPASVTAVAEERTGWPYLASERPSPARTSHMPDLIAKWQSENSNHPECPERREVGTQKCTTLSARRGADSFEICPGDKTDRASK